jgi:hypothetical protein
MRVQQTRHHLAMPQDILDCHDVHPALEERGREEVLEQVGVERAAKSEIRMSFRAYSSWN